MPESRPAVSAVVLCYDCEAYVAEAVRSVLAQEYDDPIDIVISDDASSDRTLSTVRSEVERYDGLHNVTILEQPTNAGSKSAHLSRVIPAATGDVIVSFDGDDISEPRRVRTIMERFRTDPRIHAVYSDLTRMDSAGRRIGPGSVPHPPPGASSREWFARVDAYAAGGTLAVRRSVFEAFGPLEPDINEDILLPFRASLLGEVAYIDEALVHARLHPGSFTADPESFSSLAAYRARMRLGIERARRNADSRLADIHRAEELVPGRARDMELLRHIVRESLSAAELSGQLLSTSLAKRVAALVRLTARGAYREHLVQHAALALAPRTYLRYKRRRSRRYGTPSGE